MVLNNSVNLWAENETIFTGNVMCTQRNKDTHTFDVSKLSSFD